MMSKIILSIIILSLSVTCYAGDTIRVHKDARLDVFTAKQAYVNKLTAHMTSGGQYKGFRLQVLSTRTREEAFNTKASLLQQFPEQKAYILYQSPYFKVRIGNFPNKQEADAFKKQLSKVYAQPAYLVEDIIDYTPTADEIEN